jgi:hypothetical protein
VESILTGGVTNLKAVLITGHFIYIVEDGYNYYNAKIRITIEHTFGFFLEY